MDKVHDWKRFCKLIQTSDEVSAGKPRSGEALTLMFAILSEYPFEAVAGAVAEHMRTNKFLVQPADVTRLIEGSPEERSAVAWRVFLRALDRHGYYQSVRFPDAAYHYAIDALGGWRHVSESWHLLTDKEIEFRGREWRRLYEIGLRSASFDRLPGKTQVRPYLPGFHEINNSNGGYSAFIPGVLDVATGKTFERPALPEWEGAKALPVMLEKILEGNSDVESA